MKLSYDEKKEKEPILREMWRSIFGDPKRYEDFYYQKQYRGCVFWEQHRLRLSDL